MRIRLKGLRKTMNENTSELLTKNEQYYDMQTKYHGINTSIGYLNIEIKRTIIMLKICLYRQRNKKKF